MARPRVRARAGLLGALLAVLGPVAGGASAEPRLVEDGQGLAGAQHRTNAVAVSPDGAHVYAVTKVFLLAMRREGDGTLAMIEEHELSGVEGRRVAVPSDGLGVLALVDTGFGDWVVQSYRRNPGDGKLTKQEDESENLGAGPRELVPSHDGALVYVTSWGHDGVVVYARDAATGNLEFAQRVRQEDDGVSGLVDPTWLAVSPDDRHVYVVGSVDGAAETLVLLERQEDDTLSFVEALEIDESFASQSALNGLVVTPDGEEVLALHGAPLVVGGNVAVLRYARNASDGRLSFTGAESLSRPDFSGTFFTPWFALAPDGRRLYFDWLSEVSPKVPSLTEWERGGDGALTPLASVPIENGVASFAGVVSPDGAWLYTVPAQGGRVYAVPEPAGAAAAAPAALAALAARRRARRARPLARASPRA